MLLCAFYPDRKEPRSPGQRCDADLWDCDLCRRVSQDATHSERRVCWAGRCEAQRGLMKRPRHTGRSGSSHQSPVKLSEMEAEQRAEEVLRWSNLSFRNLRGGFFSRLLTAVVGSSKLRQGSTGPNQEVVFSLKY